MTVTCFYDPIQNGRMHLKVNIQYQDFCILYFGLKGHNCPTYDVIFWVAKNSIVVLCSILQIFRSLGLTGRVVGLITINTHLFVLDFCTDLIYIYTYIYGLTGHIFCVWWEVSLGINDPDSAKIFSHNHYHISEFWVLKWSEFRLMVQNLKSLFICVIYGCKLCTYVKGWYDTIE